LYESYSSGAIGIRLKPNPKFDASLHRPLYIEIDPSRYERGQGPAIFIFGRLASGATLDTARARAKTS